MIERITVPTNNGLYVFETIDNIAKLHYFQKHPEYEATEQTTIIELELSNNNAAYCQMIEWYNKEKDSGFIGYNLKREPMRVRDFNWSVIDET